MAAVGSRRRSRHGTTVRVGLLLLGAALLVSAALAPVARAAIPIPMTTQGNALTNAGTPLPVGTPIRTFVDGVDYSDRPQVSDSAGSYVVHTQGNHVINATTPEPSPTKYGANAGETLVYTASDLTASAGVFQETHAWVSDLVVTQNLHLGSAASTPEPLKIQGLVTQPARGGLPYVFLCNPTANPISLADYYLQKDAPGTYYGGNLSLSGALAGSDIVQENLTTTFGLVATGDALKVVYRNPGGAGASASGMDLVVDRLEFNATTGGTLDWQPGSTIMGSAPAPGPGQILERSPSCADTNSPSDFHLAAEPGLPSSMPPTVSITAPGSGQNVQGGQVFTIRWTMADAVFVNGYLQVWVNVTYNGVTTPVLAGTAGATAVDWNVPSVDAPGATVHVEVIDPFGAHGNATTTFNISPATPYSAYVAILVIVVVAVFILWAYRRARKRSEAPPASVAPTLVPPPAPPTSPVGPAAPAAGKKVCPQCHTEVNDVDETCFYCGHSFTPPP